MAGSRALDREKKTLAAMLEIYCRQKHKAMGQGLCAECGELWEYAEQRLEKCPFGAAKGACSKCEVHCYKPEMRKRIQAVMRYSGPRMLKKHPVMAARHLLKELKRKPKPGK